MTQTTQILTRGSTNVIEVRKAKDLVAGGYPTDLECRLTLRDANDEPLPEVADVPMPHVNGTTGRNTLYRYAVPATVALPDDTYTAVIIATKAGAQRTYNIACTVVDG